ncbi:hypothetical protein [Shewanella waksmanii]|uniref:hypothetical protein n=1 Tax=Shewanella waksmanii TaxID=213783 RepID=UPI0037364B28
MDAVVERPWVGLQRAEEVSAQTTLEARPYFQPSGRWPQLPPLEAKTHCRP